MHHAASEERSSESDCIHTQRPGRVDFRALARNQLFGAAAFGWNYIDLPGSARFSGAENDPLAVWGPLRQAHCHGRIGELKPLAAIYSAAPKSGFGVAYIGQPFSIPGEIQPLCGDAGKVGQELLRLPVVAHHFSQALSTDDKEAPPLPTRGGRHET